MIGLNDEELFDRFGDIIHEIPELAMSLRRFELGKRSAAIAGAFEFHSDWVTVSSAAEDLMSRLHPANAR